MTEQPGIARQLGRIAVIGGGKMGEAIIAGLIESAQFAASDIFVAEPSGERQTYLSDKYGITSAASGTAFADLDTVILAVKPQAIRNVMAELVEAWSFKPARVISIAAGVPTTVIQEYFAASAVVRVMPNVALTVRAGMSAVATAQGTADTEGELVRALFATLGEALVVLEAQIDAVTAISGSGPAYFALLSELLAAAGSKVGLDSTLASTLAAQTLIGTATLLDREPLTAAELRQSVTSPGGTTQAALDSFAADDLGTIVQNAVDAAVKRAEELA
jgi:pyrroline-5-carboxylate reductase